MSLVDSPCLDCNKREIGCHGKCQEYMDFKAKRSEENRKFKDYMLEGTSADKFRRDKALWNIKRNRRK